MAVWGIGEVLDPVGGVLKFSALTQSHATSQDGKASRCGHGARAAGGGARRVS